MLKQPDGILPKMLLRKNSFQFSLMQSDFGDLSGTIPLKKLGWCYVLILVLDESINLFKMSQIVPCLNMGKSLIETHP